MCFVLFVCKAKAIDCSKMQICKTQKDKFIFKGEDSPSIFMQIGWMENEFNNLTAKIWANLDNPVKSYDYSKVALCYNL